MSKNLRKMVTFGLVVAMGILPISAHSNIASAQEQEQTGTLVMTKEDEIDSFDDLAGMTLDMSNKNIVPDENGKVEIDLRPLIVKNNFSLNGGMRIKLYYLQGRFIILLFLLPLCGSIPHLRIYAIKVPKTDLRDSQFIS